MGGTLDIAPTILDRARIQPYNGIQGQSLLPAIGGETLAPRDSMVIEDDQQRAIMGFAAPPRLRIADHRALSPDDRARRSIRRALRPAATIRTKWTICSTIRRIARCAAN